MTEKPGQNSSEKLAALRGELQTRGLDGFIVPRTDEFQNEYVPENAERLAWLTEFTGSAGAAVVLAGKAVVMSDGRYTAQLEQQVDKASFGMADSEKVSPGQWIADNAAAGAKIGYDPKLHTDSELKDWNKILKAKKITLVPVEGNPLDAVWTDRPAGPAGKAEIFPDSVAGRSAADKRDGIAKTVTKAGGHAVVIAQPISVAWLLNVRGTDVPHTPVVLSYAVVHDNGDADWFVDPAKVTPEVRQHLGNQVRVRAPTELADALKDLAKEAAAAGKPVLADAARTPVWFQMTLEAAGAAVENIEDPCLAPRAIKTPQEQKSIIDVHVRDGVAVTRFLKWVEEEAPKGNLSEIDIVEKLLSFRKMDPGFRDDSFDTISGWAGNGAIIHYRVTPETNKTITPPGILLVDSGAQYPEGTTDITRTVAVGPPTDEMKENFTRVLKGHIAVATARFPEGITGAALDYMARKALFDADLDYDHGTGHGVGCYLAVHEPAAHIAKPSPARPPVAFRAGMLISNEPGFYKTGAYGIRIENLVLVKEDGQRRETERKIKMLAFETVTLAPLDRNLIKVDMLDDEELQWLNDYHERVYQTLAPRLEADEAAWLRRATLPVKKNDVKLDYQNGFPPPPPAGPYC